jgi:L,D-transpeptidase catalytic domain
MKLARALGLALAATCLLWTATARAASVTGGTAGEPSGAPAPEEPPPSGAAVTSLSNEVTLTTWAHPEVEGAIYARPETRSHRIARVQLTTSDGFAEVYVLLASFRDEDGREWVKVRIPGRPNGRTGWMARELLGEPHSTRWSIVVHRRARHMDVYYAGRLLRIFPVGVGKPSTPTPTGRFWIDERFKLTDPSSPYWPYALGTSDYSTLSNWPGEGVVGIHGPYGEPQKIPGDPSHGCIRMLAPDITWLAQHVTLGTPVDIVR